MEIFIELLSQLKDQPLVILIILMLLTAIGVCSKVITVMWKKCDTSTKVLSLVETMAANQEKLVDAVNEEALANAALRAKADLFITREMSRNGSG